MRLQQRSLWVQWLCLCMTVLALVGCGFHLRGNVTFPEAYRTAFIESNEPAYSLDSVAFYIQRALRSQVTFVDNIKEADMIINVQETYDSRIVSSNTTGIYRTYTNELFATIYISDRQGNLIFRPEQFSKSESFSLDEREPLAKTTAEEAIKRELAIELSQDFVRRLGVQMRNR